MQQTIVHGLSQALAIGATRAALESYQQRYPENKPTGTWVAENKANIQFVIAGVTLKGTISVDATTVTLDMDVPLLFRPFQGKVLAVVDAEIRQWIEWAKEGRIAPA